MGMEVPLFNNNNNNNNDDDDNNNNNDNHHHHHHHNERISGVPVRVKHVKQGQIQKYETHAYNDALEQQQVI